MALTAARSLRSKVDGRTAEYPIKDAAIIYEGALVCIDGNGQAVPAAHGTASLKWGGVAIRGGTGVADLSVKCVVERRGTRWLPFNATINANLLGQLVTAFDDEKVDLAAATTNDYTVGKVVAVDTALSLVEVDLQDRVA